MSKVKFVNDVTSNIVSVPSVPVRDTYFTLESSMRIYSGVSIVTLKSTTAMSGIYDGALLKPKKSSGLMLFLLNSVYQPSVSYNYTFVAFNQIDNTLSSGVVSCYVIQNPQAQPTNVVSSISVTK